MTDDELKSLFRGADEAAPPDDARARAKQAALAAFAAAQEQQQKNIESDQGKVAPFRPIADIHKTSDRRKPMSAINQRWLMSGAASAAVLVLTVSVLMNVSDPKAPPPTEEKRQLADAGQGAAGLEEVVVTAARKQEMAQPVRSLERAESELAMADAPAALSEPMEAEAFAASGAAAPSLAKIAPASPPIDTQPPAHYQDEGRDKFENIQPSPIKLVAEEPVSTFSVDVDTAAYSFIRRQLNQGVLPQKDAVRVEEMVNYFDYAYPLPDSREQPFKAAVAVADSPWKKGNKLIHIGIRGYELSREKLPASNLVFLLDTSGSMDSPDKLPLVKQSLGLLLSQLQPTDTVAIVAYAGAAGTVLEPTPAKDKQKILAAMDRLSAGGSTAGGEGIELAYQLAKASFNKQGVNRVILATDGDFNVGITNPEELKGFVERQRGEGIYLSVLGFGQGNYQDQLMQALAQNGNGVAAYIDTLGEAQKVLVNEATSTLFPIAKDVKIQMEFNPATVSEYRLLGYETRALKREDFNNDKVDAGDIGAGHRVTAIYEITPVGADSGLIEPTRYEQSAPAVTAGKGDEYGFLKIRYKLPAESASKLITTPVTVRDLAGRDKLLARETAFATAVAGFAELLRGGEYAGDWTYQDVIKLANANKGEDDFGYRTEFVQLVRKAELAEGMR